MAQLSRAQVKEQVKQLECKCVSGGHLSDDGGVWIMDERCPSHPEAWDRAANRTPAEREYDRMYSMQYGAAKRKAIQAEALARYQGRSSVRLMGVNIQREASPNLERLDATAPGKGMVCDEDIPF